MTRSMYVNEWDQQYADQDKVAALAQYCTGMGITELHFYDLQTILPNSQNYQPLSNALGVLSAAGVTNLNAAYSSTGQIANIGSYNQASSVQNHVLFTGTIAEIEWWLSPNDWNGAMSTITAARGIGIDVYVYIGHLTAINGTTPQQQMNWLASNVDRLFLAAYQPTANSTFENTLVRMGLMNAAGEAVSFTPIFSAEPQFMADWLWENGAQAGETIYANDFASWKQSDSQVSLSGDCYFTSTWMTGQEISLVGKRVHTGQTSPVDWQSYGDRGIYVDVDTSEAGFTAVPRYFTTLSPQRGIWATTGATSVYSPEQDRFRVYLRKVSGTLTPEDAQSRGWYLSWVGVGS
jgi:hypothetical protein